MTTYHLPEGMTAAEVAADLRHAAEGARTPWAKPVRTLKVLADAIDPPKPPSVVTDEMVDEVANEVIHPAADGYLTLGMIQGVLEAAVECGWTPPSEGHCRCGDPLHLGVAHHSDKACWFVDMDEVFDNEDRLVMAEGLLRRCTRVKGDEEGPYLAIRNGDLSDDEAEYLRSLDGEGDSDE